MPRMWHILVVGIFLSGTKKSLKLGYFFDKKVRYMFNSECYRTYVYFIKTFRDFKESQLLWIQQKEGSVSVLKG